MRILGLCLVLTAFEPSLANDCAYIDPVGNWRTSDCSYLSSFVCEARP